MAFLDGQNVFEACERRFGRGQDVFNDSQTLEPES